MRLSTRSVRRSQESSHELGESSLLPSSKRNLSAHAISGRKNSWSYNVMPISMPTMAQPMAPRLRASIAIAM